MPSSCNFHLITATPTSQCNFNPMKRSREKQTTRESSGNLMRYIVFKGTADASQLVHRGHYTRKIIRYEKTESSCDEFGSAVYVAYIISMSNLHKKKTPCLVRMSTYLYGHIAINRRELYLLILMQTSAGSMFSTNPANFKIVWLLCLTKIVFCYNIVVRIGLVKEQPKQQIFIALLTLVSPERFEVM